MRNKRVFEMSIMALFIAIITILTVVPGIGYLPISIPGLGVNPTIMHIPVLIGAIILGRKNAWALGLVFGLSSLFVAYTRPAGPVDLLFQNPLVSVLPRVLFGFITYELYALLAKFTKEKLIDNQIVVNATSISVAFFVATLLHTIMVVYMIYVFGKSSLGLEKNAMIFIWTAISAAGIFEAIAAVVIGTPVAERIKVYLDNN